MLKTGQPKPDWNLAPQRGKEKIPVCVTYNLFNMLIKLLMIRALSDVKGV
jgi:hypothetical protein